MVSVEEFERLRGRGLVDDRDGHVEDVAQHDVDGEPRIDVAVASDLEVGEAAHGGLERAVDTTPPERVRQVGAVFDETRVDAAERATQPASNPRLREPEEKR